MYFVIVTDQKMKSFTLLIFTSIIFNCSKAQDLSGQWKGMFTAKTASKKTIDKFSYVIELKQKGDNWEGVSYSYHTENEKKYYSICTIIATKKSGSNIIDIWETRRTKTNNTGNYSGLQHHKLVYKKSGDREYLIGTWDHAYDKDVNSIIGKTSLERNKKQPILAQISKAVHNKKLDITKAKLPTDNAAKKVDPKKIIDSSSRDISRITTRNSYIEVKKKSSFLHEMDIPDKVGSYSNYTSRKKNVIRTIYTNSQSLTIDIYDNGEIDGDSITVLFNDKIVQFKQMLRSKPLSFTVEINQENDIGYELVMYAENIGTITPNTALMIITDSKNRYEIRVSSTLQQSGAIKFMPQKSLN